MKLYTFEIEGLSEDMMLEFKKLADDNDLDYNVFEYDENELRKSK